MKYIYGPVQSRRLGLSLGLSLTPYKVCSFDCVYCQLGRTTRKTNRRDAYLDIGEVVRETAQWFKSHPDDAGRLDYVSLAGSGEPTLHTHIGEVISGVKSLTATPVAVLTNASLFMDPAARAGVIEADLLIPSLDAVTQDIFEKIDRPVESTRVEDIIEGLIKLRSEFKNRIWLEIMIVRGMNDMPEHIEKLKEVIARINPDKIQLNSPVRTTAECGIEPADQPVLEQIKASLGDKCEIV